MPVLPDILVLAIISEVPLPGTQPNELIVPPEPSSTCNCHDFSSADVTSPGQSYKATMMALSGRDPFFRAALQVSFDDKPELTDLCIRCHVPNAWLDGRSAPSDGSLITPEDLESITCDVCHRAVRAEPPLIGDGQYTISPSVAKRAPRGAAPLGGHMVVTDSYVSSPELCGVCHSLFNPTESAHDASGTNLGGYYYEQRTYEEWVDSVFPSRDETCISCHMTRGRGAAVRSGCVEEPCEVYDDLAIHDFVGGNKFSVQAVRMLNPNLGISGLTTLVSRWVDQSHARAVKLEVTSPAVMVQGGDPYSVSVRLTNRTGHKLPTGYPEGRRVYLEVKLALDGMQPEILSGEWDQRTGMIIFDPQVRTYETQHGRVENGVGARTHHLILMNQVLSDTRIPPEGFIPSFEDMIPQGRDYGGAPPFRHWDDHTYTFTAPEVAGTVTGTITVRAMFQSTDGEIVSFLLEETQGKPEHDDLAMVWAALDHAPPGEMARKSIPITISKRMQTDGGTSGGGDDGVGGCSCVTMRVQGGETPWSMLMLALLLHRFRRRSTHHGIPTSRTSLSKERTRSAHLG